MSSISTFRYYFLTWFGKPKHDRQIYKIIRKMKVQSIVEIGLGDGSRSETMIQVAQKFLNDSNIRYTGIDLFDGRDATQSKLLLRDMHKRVNGLGAKCQLVPGGLQDGITRIANSHLRTDLILISAGYSSDELQPIWFYLPRMLHSNSIVLIQSQTDGEFECLNRLEIEKRAPDRKHGLRSAA